MFEAQQCHFEVVDSRVELSNTAKKDESPPQKSRIAPYGSRVADKEIRTY